MAEADLSKIVDMIMKNPGIIEEIKGLMTSNENVSTENSIESSAEKESMPSDAVSPESIPSSTVASDTTDYIGAKINNGERARRSELLRALKPYVSNERGRVIESMMSIADILDMMRVK